MDFNLADSLKVVLSGIAPSLCNNQSIFLHRYNLHRLIFDLHIYIYAIEMRYQHYKFGNYVV